MSYEGKNAPVCLGIKFCLNLKSTKEIDTNELFHIIKYISIPIVSNESLKRKRTNYLYPSILLKKQTNYLIEE